jgi:hypothetical protein
MLFSPIIETSQGLYQKGAIQMKRLIMPVLIILLASCGNETVTAPEQSWSGLYRVFAMSDETSNTCNESYGPYAYLKNIVIDGSTFSWGDLSGTWDEETNMGIAIGTYDKVVQGVGTVTVTDTVMVWFGIASDTRQPIFGGTEHEKWSPGGCHIYWQMGGEIIQ